MPGHGHKEPQDDLRPAFMTMAMWFAWLLRGDVRAQCQKVEAEGYKAFAAWWILFGEREYPNVWAFGPQQTRVAMEPVLSVLRHRIPLLLLVLWNSRLDLQESYPLTSEEAHIKLLCWYRLEASTEYKYAPPLPDFALAHIDKPCSEFQNEGKNYVSWLAAAFWAKRPELQRAFDLRDPKARMRFASWFETVGKGYIPACASGKQAKVAWRGRSLQHQKEGVNLIGFVHAEFGLGEDVRAMSRALESAGYAHVIVDAGNPPGVRARDGSRSAFIKKKLVFDKSVFCMSAFDAAGLYLERGREVFSARTNIGYWAWELPRFPDEWASVSELVDEIWAATTFQKAAYTGVTACPVIFMAPAVYVNSKLVPCLARQPFTFIYPFDPRSFLSRKNPHAVIAAFRRCFPRRDRAVRLILRVNGNPTEAQGWSAVKAAMRGDSRIKIIAGTFDRDESLRFLLRSDCLVSPHRAEGFGRNIVEALALGTPVLATGYSGSADFLEPCERLRYRLKKVAFGQYPFGYNQLWAEPLIGSLVKRMRLRRMHPPSLFARRARTQRLLLLYAPDKAGRRFADRLAAVEGGTQGSRAKLRH